jgi:hypothetical protein
VISEAEYPIVMMIFLGVSDLPSWSRVVRVVPLSACDVVYSTND